MFSRLRGFSLLQVVMGMALLAVFTVAFMKQFKSMSGAQRSVASKSDAIGAETGVRTALQNADACRRTFQGLPLDGQWHPVVVRNPRGDSLFETGNRVNDVEIEELRARADGAGPTYFMTLEMRMRRPMGGGEVKASKTATHYANVVVDGAGVVLACVEGSTGAWQLVHQEIVTLPFFPRNPPVIRGWLVRSGLVPGVDVPMAQPGDHQEMVHIAPNCVTSPPCTERVYDPLTVTARGNIVVATARTVLQSSTAGLTAIGRLHFQTSTGSGEIDVGMTAALVSTETSFPTTIPVVPGTALQLRQKIIASRHGNSPNDNFVIAGTMVVLLQHYLRAGP